MSFILKYKAHSENNKKHTPTTHCKHWYLTHAHQNSDYMSIHKRLIPTTPYYYVISSNYPILSSPGTLHCTPLHMFCIWNMRKNHIQWYTKQCSQLAPIKNIHTSIHPSQMWTWGTLTSLPPQFWFWLLFWYPHSFLLVHCVPPY